MSEQSAGGSDQLRGSGWGVLALVTAGLIALSAMALLITTLGVLGAWDRSQQPTGAPAATVRWTCDPALPAGFSAACDDAASLPDTREVARAARRLFGKRYAGLWVDRSTRPARLVVGLVDKRQGDGAAARRVSGGDQRVVTVQVSFSMQQLQAIRSDVISVVAGLTRWSLVRVDAQANRVIVAVLPRERRAVEDALAGSGVAMSAVQFEEYELTMPA